MQNETLKDHRRRIDGVIDYILKNLTGDLSLEKLAEVANYSPFHLQRIFKEVIGDSPKQYVMRMRLETAVHMIVVHPHKSLLEIALDTGFSSPAVFSRAIRNYFGYSPDELRRMKAKERVEAFRGNKIPHHAEMQKVRRASDTEFDISLVRLEAQLLIYLIVPFDDGEQIEQGFVTLNALAEAHDLLTSQSRFGGILSPHQGNVYQPFLLVNENAEIPLGLNVARLIAGKYATYTASDRNEAMNGARYFYHKWLPQSGFKIADVKGYELFSENPAGKDYLRLRRELFVPIEVGAV